LPNIEMIAVSAAGGRWIPNKPTLTYSGVGQFTIGNYDASLSYTFSNATATRSGSTITLPNATSSTYVYARSPKGITLSTASYCERRPRDSYWTVTQEFHCDTCGGPCGGCCGRGTEHPVGSNSFLACCECGYWTENNYTSAGYTFTSAEWYKIA
jgi:hypothetical protein